MHIPISDCARSIRKLANLLKPDGKLVISLRHGQTDEERQTRKIHNGCADELRYGRISIYSPRSCKRG
ncbi:hypothetical protein [Colwellia sp. MB02u-14]|jgi:hypothetical protein|uniref:hypothetical protein n=1 Tax=Colwellia sp. MB02u-14 TaxID=2759815 RepID=UPI003855BD1A